MKFLRKKIVESGETLCRGLWLM